MTCKNPILGILKDIWKLKAIIVTSIALLVPLRLALQTDSKASRCGYTLVVMAILWLTEALPIPVTALIPIVLLPILGVSTAKEVSSSYLTDTSMLFLGGLIVAVAVEEWGLHRRIALAILKIVGSQPNLLMLGLMIPTWFLSMWISNTAAASMMIPIVSAVTSQIQDVHTEHEENEANDDNDQTCKLNQHRDDVIGNHDQKNIALLSLTSPQMNVRAKNDIPPSWQSPNEPDTNFSPTKGCEGYRNNSTYQEQNTGSAKKGTSNKHHSKLSKALALSIAYAANTGGIATLTGSPPNLVLKGQADSIFERKGREYDGTARTSGITFSTWLAFALPISLLVMVLGWLWLQFFVLRCKDSCACCKKGTSTRARMIRQIIIREYQSLGKITFAECMIILMFSCLVLLWIFREPPNINGWGVAFPSGYISDSTPAIFVAVSLFILPAKRPPLFCRTIDSNNKYTPILEWQETMTKLPWGVILLLGGGFAMAKASDKSGLSEWVGKGLDIFGSYDPWVMNLILCFIVAAATEVTSNTATATLLMPILAKLGETAGINPLYLMISAAVACSFAFMLPVATPPSAIVFSHGYLTIPDMATAGLMMNVIAVFVLTLGVNTWGMKIFDLGTMPDIFTNLESNSTFSLLSNSSKLNITHT